MSALLASSCRAISLASTAVVLDVLAPAAFSTLSVCSAQLPRPSTPSFPSTSKVRLADEAHRAKPTRKQRKQAKSASGEPPARFQRGKPPVAASSQTPSAVDVLSKIRNSTPPNETSDLRVQQHNEAVLSIKKGTADPRRDFQQAFKNGWIPIRNSGQAGRLQAKDLAKVLRACTLAQRNGTKEETGYAWSEVRELALWLAGEKDMAGLVEWAWSAIETGVEGCQQVVEVWETIARGEHLALREGPKAINWAFRPKQEFSPTSPSRPKPPVFLFAAYIAARSVTHRHTIPSERPAFAKLVPTFLDPTFPALHRWLNHSDAESWLNRAFQAPAHSPDPDAFSSAIAWLRQVALVQIWYEQRSLPGLGLIKHVRGAFQRSSHKQVWELWYTLSQAITNEDYRWISTGSWDSSARQRWIGTPRNGALDEETHETDSISASLPMGPTNPAPSDSSDLSPTNEQLPPATLTQAIVNPFLSGFVRAQILQQANQIWAWLGSQSPPLRPGIVTWNGLLTGYAQRGDVNAVENAWVDLKKNGIKPNLSAWLARIDACFSAKRCDDAMQLSRLMMADKDLLQELEEEHRGRFPELFWDKLINGLLANGRKAEAETMLDDMVKAGSPLTIDSINIFLKYYTRGKTPDLPAVVRMLKIISDRELEADVFTYTMVLVALLAGGQKDATARTIQIMESTRVKPTVTTYGAIIHSLAHSGEPEHLTAAVQLLDEMERRKMQTNEIIYTSLIQGFLRAIPTTPLESAIASENEDGQHPFFRAALTLKTRMERRGIHLNRVGYNAFLGAALSLQSDWGVQLALKTFKEMKRRPGLMASAISSSSDEALGPRDEQYPDLQRDGKNVTASDTYFVLLDGFVKMRDWNRARGVVRDMERSGFEVRNKGLKRLVDRIGGSGGSIGAY